jgi:hypothetical protein
MGTEKDNNPINFKKKKVKVIRPIFETKEHKKAEAEYEEYYNRIRHMSRGRV